MIDALRAYCDRMALVGLSNLNSKSIAQVALDFAIKYEAEALYMRACHAEFGTQSWAESAARSESQAKYWLETACLEDK